VSSPGENLNSGGAKSSSGSTLPIIIGVVVGGVALLLFVIIAVVIVRRRRKPSKEDELYDIPVKAVPLEKTTSATSPTTSSADVAAVASDGEMKKKKKKKKIVPKVTPKYGGCIDMGMTHDQNSEHRPTMEDSDQFIDNFGGVDGQLYAAIFDGHKGVAVAEFLRDHLHTNLLAQKDEDPAARLQAAFAATDKETIALCEEKKITTGSTAVVAVVEKPAAQKQRTLYIANCGDARAVINRGGVAERLSVDHKGSNPDENKLIESRGGLLIRGKVGGALAVTRAFGDPDFKKWITAEPYVSKTALTSAETHLLLACDGVFDVLTDENVIEIIENNKDKSVQDLSAMIVAEAKQKGSTDNLSAMVLLLHN